MILQEPLFRELDVSEDEEDTLDLCPGLTETSRLGCAEMLSKFSATQQEFQLCFRYFVNVVPVEYSNSI